jgi:hypothetical protein
MPVNADESTSTAISKDPLAPINPNNAWMACQPLVEGVVALNGKSVMSCLEFNREWTLFLMRRLQQDIALVHDLAKCSDPSDMFGVYSAFYAKAYADYQNELLHLFRADVKGCGKRMEDDQEAKDRLLNGQSAAA